MRPDVSGQELLRPLALLSLAVLSLTVLTGCRSVGTIEGDAARKVAATYSFWQPHLLLISDTRYPRLEVEIDHVTGASPTAEELGALQEFLELYCRKPAGVHLRVDAPIARAAAAGKSAQAVAELHIDGPEKPDTAFAYFLFFDSQVAGISVRKPSTSRVPFPGAVFVDRRYLSRATGLPGASDVARRMLLHEAGHVLGLCDNQQHGDGIHCTRYPCLMNVRIEIRPNWPFAGPVVPQREFCADCQADLTAARDRAPAANLSFLGPYCVRSETGYHVVASPGFLYVHVGELAALDLEDLRQRRHNAFTEHPKLEGIATQTGRMDLETARRLVSELRRDPLAEVRGLGENLSQQLSATIAPRDPKSQPTNQP